MPREITIAGAGLVGSLASVFLAKRGFDVTVVERRVDLRRTSISAGRSINLAISTRGLHALKAIGLEASVLAKAVPMRGRMIHGLDGSIQLQRYGKDDTECIHSISRGELNRQLMDEAERRGVRIRFNERWAEPSGEALLGADGAGSAVREHLSRLGQVRFTEARLSHGYKELTLPSGPKGEFLLEKHALHIWPRGDFMLIALPNLDGSFTCTLFLRFEGATSFEQLATPEAVTAFFEKHFSDAAALLPNLSEMFFENPTGAMVTVKADSWQHGSTVLIGDAAHAIVPFFGQGMNCGFEDCAVLDSLLAEEADWSRVGPRLFRARKPNTDAIADMAVENFTEMREKVADPAFLFQKDVERVLQRRFPLEYRSRYSLVSFSRIPYRVAYEVGVAQSEILAQLCRGLRRAEDVDLALAEKLIRERLSPILSKEHEWT